MGTTTSERADLLSDRVAQVYERISRACIRAGRLPEDVTLVAVTKTFPVTVVATAREAGLHHFGENKAQELAAKAGVIPGRVEQGEIAWHAIGHLQRNKAREIVAHADVFHALDSIRLADELNRRLEAANRMLPCLVQVNVSGEASKFGIEPGALPAFLDALAPFANLRIRGLMTIAAPVEEPEEVRPQFRLLRSLLESCGRRGDNQELEWLSMGMSHDFEVAIEEGATHIRIGSALFGSRT